MSSSSKTLSKRDPNQVLQAVYNEEDSTLGTSGFLDLKAGHKISRYAVSSTIEDFRYFDVVFTKNGGLTSGLATVTGISGTRSLSVGQYVFGTGIQSLTTIASIDSDSQITLSLNATATGTNSLKFANQLKRIRITYDNATHDNVDDSERLE